jgi:hypothetical protein
MSYACMISFYKIIYKRKTYHVSSREELGFVGFARIYLKLAFQIAWPNVGHMMEDKSVAQSFRLLRI